MDMIACIPLLIIWFFTLMVGLRIAIDLIVDLFNLEKKPEEPVNALAA